MDPQSRKLFNDVILHEAVTRFGGDIESISQLDGFENFIYELMVNGTPRILRIAHSLHRNPKVIEGEIDWINYLASNQINVPRAFPSLDNHLVEVISLEDGSQFSAVLFEKATGHPPRQADWDNGLPQTLGQLLGKMHRLANTYQVPDEQIERPQLMDDLGDFADQYLPADQTVIIGKYHDLLKYLESLPTSSDCYGMIHQDAHGGNFFVDNGIITLFDFDDCLYGWYAYDIAMAFFYVLPHHCTEKDVDFGKQFLSQFLGGYRQEHAISTWWLSQIPYFLKLREIDLYVAIHRSLDLNNLDPWCASFMRDRKYKIENDIPYFLPPGEFAKIFE